MRNETSNYEPNICYKIEAEMCPIVMLHQKVMQRMHCKVSWNAGVQLFRE